jgi:hypothetical protein
MPDAVNGFLEQLSRTHNNSVEVAKRVLDGKENMIVTFKQDVAVPLRMESPARAHKFWSVDGFIEYLEKYATEDLVVLANPMDGGMEAVLDERATKGFEVVSFEPLYHPLFKPWAGRIGTRPGHIRDFAKFILEQRHVIASPDARQLAMTLSQIRVSKKVETAMGFGAQSTNGVMVETKIKGQAQNVEVDLPETITIECPVYMDCRMARMDVSLILEDDEGGVTVQLISSDVEREKIEATRAMLDKVTSTLGAVVSLGRVDYSEWSYIGKKAMPS